jgi:GT2 family glycosyltransferase/glycosyltransferase involved in cell wall biosynthesis
MMNALKEGISPLSFLHHLYLLKRHNLFRYNYYSLCYPDVPKNPLYAAGHFIIWGNKEQRNPIPLFSTEYYLEQVGPISDKTPAILHYLKQPEDSTVIPHPVFAEFDSKEKVGISLKSFYFKYLRGEFESVSVCEYFDPEYYLSKYPDVAITKFNPLVHYCTYGWVESRSCHPTYSFSEYLALHPDLRQAQVNPFLHFLLKGKKEGRSLPHHPSQKNIADYLPATLSNDPIRVRHPVSVVVPVYEGCEETMCCLESLARSQNEVDHSFIIINDCSPNQILERSVESFCAAHPRFQYIKNEVNLGFVRTANKGISLCPLDDIVLLNSDTVVPEQGWLDRLASQAHAHDNIAAVSPLSNNATLCNFPTFQGLPDASPQEALKYDAIVRNTNSGRSVPMPTAHGFCMYLRRDAIEQIGMLDAEAFGRGYGEENDWAQRAKLMGKEIILACDVLIYHKGEASFSTTSTKRAKVIAKSEEILTERYPHFKRSIAKFFSHDPVHPFRVAAGIAMLQSDPRPKLLVITHHLGGGIERYLNDAFAILAKTHHIIVCRPPVKGGMTDDLKLSSFEIPDNFSLCCNATQNIEFLKSILLTIGIERIDIHSTVLVNPSIRKVISLTKVPFRFFAHDYYTICPQINLITKHALYCGEPNEAGCNNCIAERRSYQASDIATWRINQSWLLTQSTEVVCPSHDVAERLRRYWPGGNYSVVPHEKDLYRGEQFEPTLVPLKRGEKIKVGIIGVLAAHKGVPLVTELLEVISRSKLPIELHLIGYIEPKFQYLEGNGLRVTGRYEEPALDGLLSSVQPHLLLYPAQWPETYSYTLSAGIRSGRPILAPDLGAFSERLEGRTHTKLFSVPTKASTIIQEIQDMVREKVAPTVASNILRTVKKSTSSPTSTIRVGIVAEKHSTTLSPCAYIRLLSPLFQKNLAQEITPIVIEPEEIATAPVDVIVTQRTICKDESSVEQFLDVVHARQLPLIFDLDDNLLEIDEHHPEFEMLTKISGAVRLFVNESDDVWVSTTPILEKVLSSGARAATLFPNALDQELWSLASRRITPPSKQQPIRICYMGTATHNADFALVTPALQRLKEVFGSRIDIAIVGILQSPAQDLWYRAIAKPAGEGQTYPSFVRWFAQLPQMDIGIAPLVDNHFNGFKSDIKFMDYAGVGMTTVASVVEAYKHTIEHDRSGLLVDNTADAWFEALQSLVSNREQLLKLRSQAFAQLNEKHLLCHQGNARAVRIGMILNKGSVKTSNG